MAAEQKSHLARTYDQSGTYERAGKFFNTVREAFAQGLLRGGGAFDHFFDIGGHTICLRFAGTVLVSGITKAFGHLRASPSHTPDLTVCICDSASTGTPMPPSLWPGDVFVARGDIQGYSHRGEIQIGFQAGPNILNVLDNRRNLAFYWIRDGYKLPYYESGSPLRTILHWWMSNRGCQYIHAGAVGTAVGGVLLAGKGGSGKSTTALACLDSSLLYASDDYCLLTCDPEPRIFSLYNSAKLAADKMDRFPHLAAAVSNPDRLSDEKALLFIYKYFADKMVPGFPIRAILLLRITGRPETTLAPASPVACLKALAPSTIFQLPGAGAGAFDTLTQLVRRVPRYHLELGTKLDRIPAVILDLLNRRTG